MRGSENLIGTLIDTSVLNAHVQKNDNHVQLLFSWKHIILSIASGKLQTALGTLQLQDLQMSIKL